MLNIREKRFDIRTRPGENVRGVLHIEAEKGKKVRGEIYTDHIRIVTELDRFSGSRLKLHFGVDAEGLSYGDIISGSLLLATDEGEYRIPVSVCIADGTETVSPPRVKSLSAFTLLFQDDPEAALRFYRSREMKTLFLPGENRIPALYRGLSAPGVTRESVEEFLSGASQKSAVRIHADFYKADFGELKETTQELITLRRNTWGSFVLRAECDAPFIELPKTRITEDDFVGLICRFPYIIHAELLEEETQTAEIHMRCGFDDFTFRVTAKKPESAEHAARKEVLRLRKELKECCIRYLLKHTDQRSFAEEALRIADSLSEYEGQEEPPSALSRAYLTLLCGRREEAGGMLLRQKNSGMSKESELIRYGWRFAAAVTGLTDEQPEQLADRTRALFDKNRGDYMSFMLMLLTNKDLAASPRRKLRAAESAFEAGLSDPLLFAEVLPDLKEDDSLVSRLSPFFIRVLASAAEYDELTEGLALRTAYLTANLKTWSEELMGILSAAYGKWPMDGILEAIVRLLIRGKALDSSSFPWYEKAIERDIKIIRLYEYYIETLPPGRRGVLPSSVRKYFAVSDTLSDHMKALLYANIIRNRREDPETYGIYREKMEAFAKKALAGERISEDYAVLYQKFTGRIQDEETAGKLLRVLFTSRIYSDEPGLRNVIVVHHELKGEECCPVIRGTAYVTRCTKDAVILLEDISGRRSASAAFIEEPLMEKEPFYSEIVKMAPYSPHLILSEYRRLADEGDNSRRMQKIRLMIADEPAFTEEFRKKIRKEILDYILLNPDENPLDDAGEDVVRDYLEADKSAFIRVLMASGNYRKAYELVSRCGYEGISPDLMVRLASRMIIDRDGRFDEELGLFIEHVFRTGKYDERMLEYMVRYFRGSMKEMLDLRSAAGGFYIDTFPLDERILQRSVFTRTVTDEGPEVLKAYASGGGSRKIIKNYISFVCDSMVGREGSTGSFMAAQILEMADDGEHVSFPMKLAFLKYCTEAEELTAHEEVFADRILDECEARGIRFRFFQKLPGSLIAGRHLDDRVFVEQAAEEGDTVLLKYALTDGGNTDGAVWKTEPMERIYRGIFSREFTLFYGEVLMYSVTVIHDGVETAGPERSLANPYVDFSGGSSYQRINSMIRSLKEGDLEGAAAKIAEYRKARYVAERVFRMEEAD